MAFVCAFFIVLSILCVLICFLAKWYKPRIDTLYKNNFTVAELNEPNLTEQEKIDLDNLIKRNKIIPLSYVYQNTLQYYDTFINVLGFFIAFLAALIGVGAFFSWFSFGNKIKKEITSEFNTDDFQTSMKKSIEESLENILADKLPAWLKNQTNAIELIVDRVRNEIEKENEEINSDINQS
jgi:hypothetical protein